MSLHDNLTLHMSLLGGRATNLLAGVALVAAGCGGSGGGAPDTSALRGVPWVLVDSTPSIAFGAAQVQGSTGCNRFSGAYTVDGDSMKLGPLATTQMACAPPADEVERSFVRDLDDVRHWHATEQELVLSDAGRKELLRFRVASVAGSWEATSFLQGDAIKSAIVGTHVTAHFGGSGELTGSAGCNDYGASYTADRGAIQIGEPHAQQRECPEPAGIMEQERAYLAALTEARRYELTGDQLTLLTERGTIAVTYAKR